MAKLTKIQKTELLPVAIDKYLRQNDATQVALARLADVDKAYVNQIAQGKTHIGKSKIADRYYVAIAHAIGFKFTKTHWRHFNTFAFRQATVAIENARAKKERLGIDGITGIGKTYVTTMYKRRFPKECITLKCNGTQNTKEFAKDFARAVGISDVGTKNVLLKNAVEAVKRIDGRPFVMIDEFENSKLVNIIPMIKLLADELEDIAPVILIGIGIRKMLDKAARRERNGYVQVNRRWGFSWVMLEADISEDIRKVCQELEITNRGAVNWLLRNVKDFDSLRRICIGILEEAEKSGQAVTVSLLNELYA